MVALRNVEVLVGIPQRTSSRRDEGINNAEALYIFSHGSSAHNQPARPVIEPAIMADGNRQEIAKELKDAAAAWLQGKSAEGKQFLIRAGQKGADCSRSWFTDARNGWAENAESTARRKINKMRGKAKAEALAVLKAGGDLTGIVTVGVDTDQMRRSLTFVLRGQTDLPTDVQRLERKNIQLKLKP
jgi:hypothetical protein